MNIQKNQLERWIKALTLAHEDGINNGDYEGSICHQRLSEVLTEMWYLIQGDREPHPDYANDSL
jgi:hypothetical protein